MNLQRTAAAVAGMLALALLTGLPTAQAAPPIPGDTLGGPLHAELYPSGLETAPDGTIVVADTGNNESSPVTSQHLKQRPLMGGT